MSTFFIHVDTYDEPKPSFRTSSIYHASSKPTYVPLEDSYTFFYRPPFVTLFVAVHLSIREDSIREGMVITNRD